MTARRPGRRPTRSAATRKRPKKAKTLWEVQLEGGLGGSVYDSWWTVTPGLNVEEWARRVVESYGDRESGATGLAMKAPYYAKIYKGNIPIIAAEMIDHMVERGTVGILRGFEPGEPTPDEAREVPISELVPPEGFDDGGTVRDAIHTLHAAGLLIVECDGVLAMGTPWYLEDRKRRIADGTFELDNDDEEGDKQ
jgi:hypothetical protein